MSSEYAASFLAALAAAEGAVVSSECCSSHGPQRRLFHQTYVCFSQGYPIQQADAVSAPKEVNPVHVVDELAAAGLVPGGSPKLMEACLKYAVHHLIFNHNQLVYCTK